MNKNYFKNLWIVCLILCHSSFVSQGTSDSLNLDFPKKLWSFEKTPKQIIFRGTGQETWDKSIRERGWIMKEKAGWNLWYTGYNSKISNQMFLGLATSDDGINWFRYAQSPLLVEQYVEDMCVIKHRGTYFMFAEGKNDVAHWLTSKDKIHWQEQGDLKIFMNRGEPISEGPRGTPTAFFNRGMWYLFYERDDLAVYLATSKDLKSWKNVVDEPVLKRGPDVYDLFAVAFDQIVKYEGKFYAYYHASGLASWAEWSTCIAVSDDLIHWKKFAKNPIIPVDPLDPRRSSGTIVPKGNSFLLYTTHPNVKVHLPVK